MVLRPLSTLAPAPGGASRAPAIQAGPVDAYLPGAASGGGPAPSSWQQDLARQFGEAEGRELAGLADSAPPAFQAEARGRVDLAVRMALAASRFSKASHVKQVYDRLGAARLSPDERESLGKAAEPLPTWKADGPWRPVHDKNGAVAWTDMPPRSGPALPREGQGALTSRDLSLEGLEGCLLEFEEGHQFATLQERGYVEASVPGGSWETLIEYREGKPVGPQFLDLSSYDGQTVRLRFRTGVESAPFSNPDRASGGLWLDGFVISGRDRATGESRGLPLEAVMRAQALEDLLALADHMPPGPDRLRTFTVLAGLSPERRARALPALAARIQQGTLEPAEAAAFVGRLLAGGLLDSAPSHLEETLDAGKEGIQVDEGAVRVGRVLLERREG